MNANGIVMIAVAVLAMFFGYFFGLFEGRNQGYKKRKAEEPAEPKEENPAEPEAAPPAPVPAPIVSDDPGLLRLKEENGKLRFELDGVRIIGETLTTGQRKRLIDLITRLRPWIEGHTPAPTPPSPAPRPAPVTAPPSFAPAVTPRTAPAAPPVSRIEPPAPQTMVGQIDAILQEKLADSPLAHQGIKLEESSEGGVTVVVGMQRYAGVNEVSDPQIQALLRAAIAEWEKRFTPG